MAAGTMETVKMTIIIEPIIFKMSIGSKKQNLLFLNLK